MSTITFASPFIQPQGDIPPRWTTKEDAGVFVDPDPTTQFIKYNNQMCVKEQMVGYLDGKSYNIFKVRCRQPDGSFAYIW